MNLEQRVLRGVMNLERRVLRGVRVPYLALTIQCFDTHLYPSLPRWEESRWDGPRPKGKTTVHGRVIGLEFDNSNRSGQPCNPGPRPIYKYRPTSSKHVPSVVSVRRAGLNMPRIPGAHR